MAAEDENILTMESGMSSPGNPMCEENCPIRDARKSRKPDARRMPTAAIRPIRVGMSRITVRNPLRAPLMKVS